MIVAITITDAEIELGRNLVEEIEREGKAVGIGERFPLVVLPVEGHSRRQRRNLRDTDFAIHAGSENVAPGEPANIHGVLVQLIERGVERHLGFTIFVARSKISTQEIGVQLTIVRIVREGMDQSE